MTDIISASCAVRSLAARLWPAAAGSAQINKYSAVRRARQTDICTPTGIFLTWTALHVCFQLLVPSCFCFSEAVALLAPVCYPHHRIYKIKSSAAAAAACLAATALAGPFFGLGTAFSDSPAWCIWRKNLLFNPALDVLCADWALVAFRSAPLIAPTDWERWLQINANSLVENVPKLSPQILSVLGTLANIWNFFKYFISLWSAFWSMWVFNYGKSCTFN